MPIKAKKNPPTKERQAAAPKVPTIYIYYFKIHRQKTNKFHILCTEGGSPLFHPSDFDTVRVALDPEQPSAEQS